MLHGRDETLTCNECGEEFSALVHLKRHMKEHDVGDGGEDGVGVGEGDGGGGDGGGDDGGSGGEDDQENPLIDVFVAGQQLINNNNNNNKDSNSGIDRERKEISAQEATNNGTISVRILIRI